MRDKVFIAWSGSNEDAIKVKNILSDKYNYFCFVGGNSENDSAFLSIGDTVIQQMKACNQAIIIFSNKANGSISSNLFFELGYVFAMYGPKKVHCVRKSSENLVLPSDFENAFLEPIPDDGENAFANGIVNYFIKRQKMSVTENKISLINNRYALHDKISSHYSEAGSKCSDYELAQYILFYMQAAHMFGDEDSIKQELEDFQRKHNNEFSDELRVAVYMSLSFFDMVKAIKVTDTQDVYLEDNDFFEFEEAYSQYQTMIVEDEMGLFDEWAKIFIHEHLNFADMLYAKNPNIDSETKHFVCVEAKENAEKSLELIDAYVENGYCNENNDNLGLIALLKAYIYRNQFIIKQELGEDDYLIWLKKTLEERAKLKNSYARGCIDTHLYNNFCMEYYLAVIEDLTFNTPNPLKKRESINQMRRYLDSVKKEEDVNAYLQKIATWCEKNSN